MGIQKNSWILHTPDTDTKSLLVAFLNRDIGDWDWAKQVQIKNTREVLVNGPLNANTHVNVNGFIGLTADTQLRFKGINDVNHYIGYSNNDNIDGVRIQGNGGGQLGTLGKTALQWDNNRNVNVNGRLIVNGRDILAELDNRPRFNNAWVAIESDLGNKCLDVGSHNANCDHNAGGWRQFKFVKW